MVDEDPVAVVERFLTELFERENREVLREVCTADFRIHDAGRTQTRAELYEGLEASNRAFGKTLTVQDTFAAAGEPKVVARFERTYTHRGTYLGLPPTGTEATFTAIMVARMEDGKLAEAWVENDDLGVLRQLGIVPPPEELAAERAASERDASPGDGPGDTTGETTVVDGEASVSAASDGEASDGQATGE